MSTFVSLPADSNQALGIGQFAIDFMKGSLGPGPSDKVLERTRWFHTDAVLCGLSALALGTNAPRILRAEALEYGVGGGFLPHPLPPPQQVGEGVSRVGEGSIPHPLSPHQQVGEGVLEFHSMPHSQQGGEGGMDFHSGLANGATVFGSGVRVKPEKAIVANCSAVREWDSNGTNFGYRPEHGHTGGEFGHNDFYPVVIAACQQRGLSGATALKAMVLLDEIRGRLAEVFSLKSYKLDHVVHGAIGSAATYGALMGATAEQIESAIGMFVAHYIPWRAIRAGKQLSDSKGASAAISTEAAILCMKRSMAGFVGPKDIFRNPEAVFRFFEPTTQGSERWKEQGDSPFELILSHSGDDFAVMGMHFKLGLYEHQSAGALQGVIDLLAANPDVLSSADGSKIDRITIAAYEPAFGIIGNPMKKSPTTRQSADHSMAYIVSTLIRKALEHVAKHGSLPTGGGSNDEIWKALMLDPYDYQVADSAIYHPVTRSLMDKIDFVHGGAEYDSKYPEGIPTSVNIRTANGNLDSGLVMFPAGHARNSAADLIDILRFKWNMLGALALPNGGDAHGLVDRLESIQGLSPEGLFDLTDVAIAERPGYE